MSSSPALRCRTTFTAEGLALCRFAGAAGSRNNSRRRGRTMKSGRRRIARTPLGLCPQRPRRSHCDAREHKL
eukprot:scaffold7226_cov387-Prasinococcus_capsulatus_cf.AAC.12